MDCRRRARWSARGACASPRGVVPLYRPCEAGRPRLRPVGASARASAHGSGYDGPCSEARSAHRQDSCGRSRPCASSRRCAQTLAPVGYSVCRLGSWTPGRAAAPGSLAPPPEASRHVGPRHVAARLPKQPASSAASAASRAGRTHKWTAGSAHCLQLHRSKPLLHRMRILYAEVLCPQQGKSWMAQGLSACRQKRLQAVRPFCMLRCCARQGKAWTAGELEACRPKRLRAPPAASPGPEVLAASCQLVRDPGPALCCATCQHAQHACVGPAGGFCGAGPAL